MKVVVLCIGKTNESYLRQGISIYQDRLPHYTSFEYIEMKDVKHPGNTLKLLEMEGKSYLAQVQPDDFLILLDESGKEYTSAAMASYLEKHQINSTKRLVFAIGGAFGWSDEVKQRANMLLSLSKMTFSHQMIRLFLVEQLYRAYSIIKGEKYHNP
ncbi:MAG: 23S rRNA (pseudouridine(1915)-N(3))-methyltransferase RlmH [Saprospiraceae bacterium]|nr:23S rRNA (pseudouridine(1915)-N(3))-methyltransferase RlmH [Saprospiraceae bacterium]MBK7220956.1 23S rRNA (pseudouridine(1915)-N(3))-methyltransferase RlmH [Saprospiraceae bacterium]MBK7789770.1 23S rRNA (pseudouridine(1915)-N(3))-methyltransferase RlmH [Saprospiraceae bacterium]MBK8850950.1 23S rRNA (pseudouridine(1915)-N(3))-methyltransferase RlmH [Saprospiraceae bacterium]MBK9688226.1 23S rRNA (pseudouridine(1915)-N(3))-methyltransferase RlmH [Saprospiraceae bacterium]